MGCFALLDNISASIAVERLCYSGKWCLLLGGAQLANNIVAEWQGFKAWQSGFRKLANYAGGISSSIFTV